MYVFFHDRNAVATRLTNFIKTSIIVHIPLFSTWDVHFLFISKLIYCRRTCMYYKICKRCPTCTIIYSKHTFTYSKVDENKFAFGHRILHAQWPMVLR